jgi:hypothetical protein
MARQPPRSPGARAMFPNLPSSADDLASVKTARGEVGSGAARIWNRLQSEYRASKNPEPPAWGSGMWFPKSSPAPKRKGR